MPGLAERAYVAILAGGEGTRLWPLSRSRRPKQILPLMGGRSLLQCTVERVEPLVSAERILVITERSHAADVRAQLPQVPPENVIVETSRRNTAAALLLAALHLEQRAPDALWASLHSDAYIGDDEEFRRTLLAALDASDQTDYLVTTGIRPQFPATGYGYIEQAEQLGTYQGYPLHRVERFVEKPDLETARAYVQSGRYLWNPGVFVWRNAVLLNAFAEHEPELYSVMRSVPITRIAEVYDSAPRQTIDNGILERSRSVATIPATFRWNDLGSWRELWEVGEPDANGNVVQGGGECLPFDSHNNFVYAESRLVSLVGVDDLVVVETDDALFICPRGRAEDVRLVVKHLQNAQQTELL